MSTKMINVKFRRRIRFKNELYGPNIANRKTGSFTEEEYTVLSKLGDAVEIIDPSDVSIMSSNSNEQNVRIEHLENKLQETNDLLEQNQVIISSHHLKRGELIQEIKELRTLASNVIDSALKVKNLSEANKKKFEKFFDELSNIPVTEIES